jgi:hypothetical protein
MIEPHSVHAGESAVSKITGACPTLSRSSRDASAFANTFNPSRRLDPDSPAAASAAEAPASTGIAVSFDAEATGSGVAASSLDD